MKVGEVIAGYRRDKKLTLDELARETGVNRVALWRLENGKFDAFKQWPALVVWLFGK
jgi:transcriptional regulator with XRE-family HTH domain